jgi:hypothetical protein
MERNYTLNIGDVVLIKEAHWGFVNEDLDKYVRVVGYSKYVSDNSPAVLTVPYDCELLSTPNKDSQWKCGYESFGENPLILLNVNDEFEKCQQADQYTGSSSNYYKVFVKHPTTLPEPYEAECNDIIESLQMTFAEGNAFKAIWRKAKARQGVKKKGYDNGVYDSEKVVFFGERMLIEAKDNESI